MSATSRSIRLDIGLVEAAELQAKADHRSTPSQIEFWASLGRRLAPLLSQKDISAIGQGLAHIVVHAAPSRRIDPDMVNAGIAERKSRPFTSSASNPAPFRYESSEIPGLIDRIAADGSRQTGDLVDGEFVPQ